MATSFDLGAGSFVRPSIHKVFGPYLSYPTPLNHPGRGASHSLVRILGFLYEADLWYSTRTLVYRREGPLGGIGTTAPGSCDVMPMGSKRFAPQDHG